MYGTDNNGDGYAERLGVFEEVEDIKIRTNMFAPNLVLSFSWEKVEDL